ncbi:MAG: right-handed parallel beta-helix repeat-containing protein [Ignavibacterium album]|uniref:right-handed parallel beta-helix repeat-containing protein n=1 Tax=Ignavibacterium album TaxID=591197 RepID=UPI0026F3085E|nr:right-handed parallel beta-helix repeat-containing protein [Ignavibacterium album]MCX8106847.1 right-handed parallel beta-helix repeat-containing protein [Ignavibacterium album]
MKYIKQESFFGNKIILCLTLVIFSFVGCVERQNFDDSGGAPPITGLFTEIGGRISGKLLRADSPYLVKEDLIIESSDTLIIEPNVEVYFDDGKKLVVKGTLLAKGTRYRPILFTAYNNNWEGIKFLYSNRNSVIQFCIIEKILFEKQDGTGYSAISFSESYCELKNNYIIDNKSRIGGAIGLRNSAVTIHNNILARNSSQYQGGAIHSINSNLTVINCVLYKNTSSLDGAGIYIDNSVRTEIQNNIFYKNVSQTGNHHFFYASSDSSNLIEQYNFFGDEDNDPMFLFEDDFRLYYMSPCKDAGNPDPIYNDVDGSRNDQGAYGGPFGGW